MTIRNLLAGVAAVSAIALASSASAQTATADSKAQIIQPMTVSDNNTVLDFGQIQRDANGGTVTLTSGDTVERSAVGLNLGPSPFSNVRFTLTGVPGQVVTLAAPNFNVTYTDPENVSHSMSVAPSIGATESKVTLDATTGEAEFRVGGTLTVGANQAIGTYAGQLAVTLTYQ